MSTSTTTQHARDAVRDTTSDAREGLREVGKAASAASSDIQKDLQALRVAPVVDPFTGPAILSGRASGVFFHEIFGHRVEGNRQRDVDDAQTFAGKIGQPVLPPFLSVVFDPALKKLGSICPHAAHGSLS